MENNPALNTRALLDALPGIVFTRRRSGDRWPFSHLSAGTKLLTGRAPEDFLHPDGICYHAKIKPEDAAHLLFLMDAAAEGSGSYLAEYRFLSRTGEAHWFAEKGQALRDPSGNVTGFQGFITDISELKLLGDKNLQAERRILRTLIDSWPDEIYAKNCDGVYILSNLLHARIFNISDPGEVIGKKSAAFPATEHTRTLEIGDKEVLTSGNPILNREKIYAIDGHTPHKWVLISKIPIVGKNGQVRGVISVTRDISERKRLEFQLNHSQKMEAIGRLAGSITHDFNNILTAILGYSDVLLSDPALPGAMHSHVREIHSGAMRAASLTQQLLAFSRKQPVRPSDINPNDILAKLENMLRRLIGEHITLKIALQKNPCMIKADAGQLEQVIMNMVVNARDAMPEGGHLTITTTGVLFEKKFPHPELPPGPYVQISIADDGIGMSAEIQSHIFEPFFTTKPQGVGTGLGLATCYGIIRQNGGHIAVSSEPGSGTTFAIYLPSIGSDETDRAAKKEQETLQAVPHKTILIVEDDDAVRAIASSMLSESGYRVLAASNGREALEIAGENTRDKIDLLFTDVIMPHIGGRELAEKLTSLSPEMKIIFTSGYNEEAILQQGILTNSHSFLQKPYSATDLFELIKKLLLGKTASAS